MRPVIGPSRDDNAPRFLLRPTTELEESCLTYCDNLILIQSVRNMEEEKKRIFQESGGDCCR